MRSGFALARLEGHSGEVWLGKSTRAASLVSWVAVPGPGPGTWEFSARLGDRDLYLLSQAPDAVRLPFGPKELRWSGALEVEGDNVRCTFAGPPEER